MTQAFFSRPPLSASGEGLAIYFQRSTVVIRAILFDLDDTLADYMGSVLIARAWVMDQLVERYPHEGFVRLCRRFNIDTDRARHFSDEYETVRRKNFRLFPETRKTLEALSSTCPLGLITNGPADSQAWEVEALQIASSLRSELILRVC